MKTVAILTVLGLAAASSFLVQRHADAHNDGPTTAPSTQPAAAKPTPANKFCAVEQKNPVDSRVPTLQYNGMVIGFCCPDCEAEFKKDPDKYLATMH